MDNTITREEGALLALLKQALTGEGAIRPDMDETLFSLAKKHRVLPLLYDVTVGRGDVPICHMEPRQLMEIKDTATEIVLKNFRLFFLAKYVTELFWREGIECVLLKGLTTARYYPVPEHRKSGDVDIFIKNGEDLEKAGKLLRDSGFRPEDTGGTLHFASIHQVVYVTPENIAVEIHTMLAEPFDDDEVNRRITAALSERDDYITRDTIMGVSLPVPADYMHGFELLIHMLQHFLATGFGLRLLCDWVVFWNRDVDADQQLRYLELVEAVGIKTFSDSVTAICVEYLGLPVSRIEWMGLLCSRSGGDFCIFAGAGPGDFHEGQKELPYRELLREILDAGEFGVSGEGRMVALRGDSAMDYAREFHHQMKNNYPGAARYPVLWPALWTMNLAGFLYNNVTMNRASVGTIMKKAGERGRLVKKLRIFREIKS